MDTGTLIQVVAFIDSFAKDHEKMLLEYTNPSEFKRGYVAGIQSVSEAIQEQIEAQISAYEQSQGE